MRSKLLGVGEPKDGDKGAAVIARTMETARAGETATEAKTTVARTVPSTARESETVDARPTVAVLPMQMVMVTTVVTAVKPFKTPVTLTISGAVSARAHISHTTTHTLRFTDP